MSTSTLLAFASKCRNSVNPLQWLLRASSFNLFFSFNVFIRTDTCKDSFSLFVAISRNSIAHCYTESIVKINILLTASNTSATMLPMARKHTLLTSFISNKQSSYTPQGRFAFAHNKYYATLLFLSNTPLKEIAKKVNASYGLLRKWTTEEKFIKLANGHYREFIKLLFNHLDLRIKEQEKMNKDYFKKSIGEMNQTPQPSVSTDEFGDIRSYNVCLLEDIQAGILGELQKSEAKINKMSNKGEIMEYLIKQLPRHGWFAFLSDAIADVLSGLSSKKKYAVLKGNAKKTINNAGFINSVILRLKLNIAQVILEKRNLNERDKKCLHMLISNLKDGLE